MVSVCSELFCYLRVQDARLIYTERENCFDAFKSLLHRCQGHWTDSSAGTVEKVLTELKKSFVPSAKSSKVDRLLITADLPFEWITPSLFSCRLAIPPLPTMQPQWQWRRQTVHRHSYPPTVRTGPGSRTCTLRNTSTVPCIPCLQRHR